VYAIAGHLQDPVFEFFIGIRQAAELSQRHEVLFDIFDAGLYPTLGLVHQLHLVKNVRSDFSK